MSVLIVAVQSTVKQNRDTYGSFFPANLTYAQDQEQEEHKEHKEQQVQLGDGIIPLALHAIPNDDQLYVLLHLDIAVLFSDKLICSLLAPVIAPVCRICIRAGIQNIACGRRVSQARCKNFSHTGKLSKASMLPSRLLSVKSSNVVQSIVFTFPISLSLSAHTAPHIQYNISKPAETHVLACGIRCICFQTSPF